MSLMPSPCNPRLNDDVCSSLSKSISVRWIKHHWIRHCKACFYRTSCFGRLATPFLEVAEDLLSGRARGAWFPKQLVEFCFENCDKRQIMHKRWKMNYRSVVWFGFVGYGGTMFCGELEPGYGVVRWDWNNDFIDKPNKQIDFECRITHAVAPCLMGCRGGLIGLLVGERWCVGVFWAWGGGCCGDEGLYAQRGMSGRFQNGRSLNEYIECLNCGTLDPLNLPDPLRVIEWPGRGLVTLDHRRAWCLKQHQEYMRKEVCTHVLVYRLPDCFDSLVRSHPVVREFLRKFDGNESSKIRIRW